MASDYFDFKQFRVYHDLCAMKVGTDSVVLGSIIPISGKENKILDIGTGSGVLALMMAQRSPNAQIDAIELDEAAFQQALNNFIESKWKDRLCAKHFSIQEYANQAKPTYDIIVCNPPYFKLGSNFSIDDKQRSQARHDADLPFMDLAFCVKNLLEENGQFWLILPFTEANLFIEIAVRNGFFLNVEISIFPKPNKPVKRLIMGFGLKDVGCHKEDFFIHDNNGNPSPEYVEASKDFYLRIDLK
jgi:tRNA1Val (adenine37-N6)-methyltransferase